VAVFYEEERRGCGTGFFARASLHCVPSSLKKAARREQLRASLRRKEMFLFERLRHDSAAFASLRPPQHAKTARAGDPGFARLKQIAQVVP